LGPDFTAKLNDPNILSTCGADAVPTDGSSMLDMIAPDSIVTDDDIKDTSGFTSCLLQELGWTDASGNRNTANVVNDLSTTALGAEAANRESECASNADMITYTSVMRYFIQRKQFPFKTLRMKKSLMSLF